VISLGFYGVKGGIWTVATGGGNRVWGPPGGMIAGNNELGVALVMVTPLLYYLFATTSRRLVKWALGIGMVFLAFGVLGTQSRGALLSLVAMAFVLGLKGKNPFRSSIGLAVLVLVAIAFMPDSWTQRMDTIQGYRDDTSAMSRLWTWQTLWNLAMDRPFLGGGFRSDSAIVFSLYSPIEGRDLFSQDVFVAHSIYFQALGEHGFPGLILYVSIGVWSWFAAARLSKQTVNDPEFSVWVPLLMRMCQASLVGFAVGGAFLSLMNLDVPFYIPAIVILTQATVRAVRPTDRARRAPDHLAHFNANTSKGASR
jgi:probable O-glycosylation ligase (exosortase A-associated)